MRKIFCEWTHCKYNSAKDDSVDRGLCQNQKDIILKYGLILEKGLEYLECQSFEPKEVDPEKLLERILGRRD